MDLEEWEILPRNINNNSDRFENLDLQDHDDGVIRKVIHPKKQNLDPNPRNVLDMDYFICPSQGTESKIEPNRRSRVVPTQLLQVPRTWEPIISTDDQKPPEKLSAGKTRKNPDPGFSDPNSDPRHDPNPSRDPDPVPSPRVSFKKLKENEFVDMKMDSPRPNSPLALPQIDHTKKPLESDGEFQDENNKIESEGSEKLSIWKLGLTGIGAICSFGVAAAAATFCIIFLGSNKENKSFKNKNQMLRFQLYTDDKRMKEVVHQATKLNEAISVMKGVPMARAQISFGGYYDGL